MMIEKPEQPTIEVKQVVCVGRSRIETLEETQFIKYVTLFVLEQEVVWLDERPHRPKHPSIQDSSKTGLSVTNQAGVESSWITLSTSAIGLKQSN